MTDCSSSPTAETIWSLMVFGERLADLMGGAPPQQMHADGADDDGRQHEGGNGGADAEAHTGVQFAGADYRRYATISASVSPRGHFGHPGHGSVTEV